MIKRADHYHHKIDGRRHQGFAAQFEIDQCQAEIADIGENQHHDHGGCHFAGRLEQSGRPKAGHDKEQVGGDDKPHHTGNSIKSY